MVTGGHVTGIRDRVQIGDATLYLGDCLDVMPTLGINSVTMLFCDPPYGHGNHDGDLNDRLNQHRGIESQPIENDDPESFRDVMDNMLSLALRVLPRKSCVCCFCSGGGPRPTFAWLAERMDRAGLQFFHSVIWDKSKPGLGQRYRRQHEMIMIAYRSDGDLAWPDADARGRNVITVGPSTVRDHPNEKPIKLCQYFIKLHTAPGNTVLDPFMGSGTTGVACAQLGRKFIGIEFVPDYFDIACRRIEEAQRQGRLFEEPRPKAQQGALI